MWISIEKELPKCLASDLFTGGTKIKVLHPDLGEGYSYVLDHDTWYYNVKKQGITHWWKEE